MDDLEGFEEIGGRCDTVYTCDQCDESEWIWDEDGSEVIGFTRMFRIVDEDICEHCLRQLMAADAAEIADGLEREETYEEWTARLRRVHEDGLRRMEKELWGNPEEKTEWKGEGF